MARTRLQFSVQEFFDPACLPILNAQHAGRNIIGYDMILIELMSVRVCYVLP